MLKFIKDLPTATRRQRITQALVLLVAVGVMVYLLRDVPHIFSNADWRVNKPLFDEGRVDGGRYIHDGLGWEMAIPDGWELTPTRSQGERRHHAQRMKRYGVTDIELNTAKELVSFSKGELDMFVSEIGSADGISSETDLMATMIGNCRVASEEFQQMGLETDGFDHPRREVVGGKVFYTSTAEIAPPGRQGKAWIISYEGVISDRYLVITIGYTDPWSKFELLEAWRGSVFRSAVPVRPKDDGGTEAETVINR